nr:hypothetical protein [Acutalibacter muris]
MYPGRVSRAPGGVVAGPGRGWWCSPHVGVSPFPVVFAPVVSTLTV